MPPYDGHLATTVTGVCTLDRVLLDINDDRVFNVVRQWYRKVSLAPTVEEEGMRWKRLVVKGGGGEAAKAMRYANVSSRR